MFDGKIFRTTKLSSIFKLKQFFLPELSLTVHYPRLYYEHTKLANYSALPNIDSVVWEDIRDELLRLEEIIHGIEEKDDSIESQIHSLSPPWAA